MRSGWPTSSPARASTPTTLAYFTKRGEPIWDEPRGLAAGYRWPQISVHRGALHTILHTAAVAEIGADRIHTGCHLDRITETANGVEATFIDRRPVTSVRRRMARCSSRATGSTRSRGATSIPTKACRSGTGHCCGAVSSKPHRCSTAARWCGPVTRARSSSCTRCSTCPTAASRSTSSPSCAPTARLLLEREDWNLAGDLADFLPQFESWTFPWLDVPALIASAPTTFLFPMVDRDPIERWSFGRVDVAG